MNGVLIVNKPSGYTSRDIVNLVSKELNTKKVGHTGTLDPLAEGVLVICIGKALKICELLTSEEKEYIATVNLGMETDSIDLAGKILKNIPYHVEKEKILETLENFPRKYLQEVPIYSAVKVNGRKLYEYARSNKQVELPKKEVTIKSLELLDEVTYENNQTQFKIKCTVSKGTYIRSLVRDIGNNMNAPAVMTHLIRTKQGSFNIKESYTIEDIKNRNYKLISVQEAFPEIPTKIVDGYLLKRVKNGAPIDKFVDTEEAFLVDEYYNLLALYKNDTEYARTYKMFI